MLFSSAVSNRIESNSTVCFYFFIILLLGVLIGCEKESRESVVMSDLQSVSKVWHQRRTCFNMADPRLEETKRFFQVID